MLFLLTLEFILGMLAALYVTFPTTSDQHRLWDYAWSDSITATHMVVAMILVVFGIYTLIRSIRLKRKSFLISSSIGLAAILLAAVGGERFVSTQSAGWSLLMALSFLLALSMYGRFLIPDNHPGV